MGLATKIKFHDKIVESNHVTTLSFVIFNILCILVYHNKLIKYQSELCLHHI